MPTAIALRSFDHNGKYAKGDAVTFDRITIDALRRARLVGPDVDGAAEPGKSEAPAAAPVPTLGALGKPPKPGKKSVALPADPASLPPTLPPSTPGDLPPPLPVASS